MVYSSLNVRPSFFVLIPLRYRYQSLYLVQFWDVYDGTDGVSVSMTRSQNLQVTVVYPAWNGMEWNRYHSNLWLDLQLSTTRFVFFVLRLFPPPAAKAALSVSDL